MYNKQTQRCLSFLLALFMVFSIMPISALATETNEQASTSTDSTEASEPTSTEASATAEEEDEIPTESSAPSSEETENNSAVAELQDRIDAVLLQYGITDNMTDEEIANAIIAADSETVKATMDEIDAIEGTAESMPEAGLLQLDLDLYSSFVNVFNQLFTAAPIATTVTVLDGQVSVADSVGTGTVSNGTVTITATGGFTSRTTNTITVYNETSSTATLSFDYSVSSAYSHTLPADSGTFSVILDADASTSFSITSKALKGTVTLTMSNFSLVAAAENSDITFEFDSNKGSVTVDGAGIASGTTQELSLKSGAALVATPNTGVTFLGWISKETGQLLSTATSYTLSPAEDMTVQAVFVTTASDTAWFLASGTHLFNDLNEAATYASSSNVNKTVILMNNGTLPAGDYTIPAGVTLLIPYDDANTLCTTKPTVDATTGVLSATAAAWKKPSAYRTLIMASGAHITVNGAMSISGTQCAAQRYNGMPTGPLGFVTMENGSTITINSGAKLYVWGYITGSGTVTVKSGGIVYEDFQVRDWRGGTAASYMLNRDERVFPISQYYVQNVEVPMTLEAGAKEYGYMSLVASKIFGDTTVPFIGSDAMFVNSGSITKDYLESDDRLKVQINGDLTMSSLVLSVSSYDMDSSKYVLPITNSITVVINSGTTIISQDMALLPSAKIEIGQNAALQMADGISLFVYDLDEWDGKKYVYSLCDVSPLPYANKGSIATRAALGDATIIVNGTFDASKGYVYTTTGGSNICSTGEGTFISGTLGTSTITYQATQSGTTITFSEVAISPAKLKNADGSYVSTSATTYNYSSAHGKWYAGTHTETTNTTAATCTENGSTTTSCPCGWSTSTTISATGHSYGDWVISAAPTYDREGTQSRTCGCGDVQNRGLEAAAKVGDTSYAILKEAVDAAAGTSNAVTLLADISGDVTISQVVTVDKNGYTAAITAGDGYALSETSGIVTVWALIKLSGTSVTAGDSLDIYFYVDASELGDGTYYAEITRIKLEKDSGGAYTVEKTVTETIGSDQWASYGAYLRFSYNGIAAKEMTDLVSVTIYDANGKQISATVTESVESYALRSLEKHTDTMLHTALVDMLNYGAAAQKYFGYKADDLANANLTAEQQALATTTVTCEDATTSSGAYSIAGATVTAESDLYFTFYFGIPAEDVTGMNAVVSYTDHNGKSCEQTIAGSDFVSYGSYYGVCVTDLAVADGRVLLTCVLQKDGETVATATSSVESYIAVTIEQNTDVEGKENLVTLCNMLMRFIESAHDYFHRNDVSG